MNLQQLKQKKLEEFEEQFADYGGEYSNTMIDAPKSMLKSFISSAMDDIQNATIEVEKERGEFIKRNAQAYISDFIETLIQAYSALNNLKTK